MECLLSVMLQSWWNADHGTWALVAVGTVGTLVAIWTLLVINRQTTAVKASTDALINSERAWIMVEVEPMGNVGGIFDGEEIVRDIITHSTTADIRIISRNDGKTPAWITQISVGIDVVDSLPAKPNWDIAEVVKAEPEPVSVGASSKLEVKDLNCNKARDSGIMIVIYGIVEYRDIFAGGRSTTFGYRVSVDGRFARLASYPEYNRNI